MADQRLGVGVWSFDRVMRQIPDHFHAHARDPDWWFRRFGAMSDRPSVIKYLGSKRRLVPALTELCRGVGCPHRPSTCSRGTTRVAQAFKGVGAWRHRRRLRPAPPTCWPAATWPPMSTIRPCRRQSAGRCGATGSTPSRAGPGYVTATFCEASRYFQPENGARIDAVRDAIEAEYVGTALWPVLITSLLEAADRVDSTTGLQMAYLKQWADRVPTARWSSGSPIS